MVSLHRNERVFCAHTREIIVAALIWGQFLYFWEGRGVINGHTLEEVNAFSVCLFNFRIGCKLWHTNGRRVVRWTIINIRAYKRIDLIRWYDKFVRLSRKDTQILYISCEIFFIPFPHMSNSIWVNRCQPNAHLSISNSRRYTYACACVCVYCVYANMLLLSQWGSRRHEELWVREVHGIHGECEWNYYERKWFRMQRSYNEKKGGYIRARNGNNEHSSCSNNEHEHEILRTSNARRKWV